jgi:hypothetical protein
MSASAFRPLQYPPSIDFTTTEVVADCGKPVEFFHNHRAAQG